MSQDNDKIKEENIAVGVPVSNSENNNVVSNEVKNEVAKAVSHDQNTFDIGVNNMTQEFIPNPNPSFNPLIREKIVLKAVEFLTAAAVKSTPLDRKINFLRAKGLTDQEVQESINRASVLNQNRNSYIQTPPHGYYNSTNTSGTIQIPYESQSWFRRIFWPLTVAATVAYIGYQIYKKYLENWLFGKQKSSLLDRIEVIELSVQRCTTLLEKTLTKSEPLNPSVNQSRDLDIIRAELKSIKSLLLNRSQFPPAPVSSSIPQWQLPKNTKPQAELQNKANDSDTQIDVLQQSVFNGTDNISPNFPLTTNVESTSTADDDQCKLNESTPNN